MPSSPLAPPAETLVALLLEQSEDYAFFLTAPDGTVTHWYRGAEHIFGYNAQEMVGQSTKRLFNEEDLARGAADHEMELALAATRAEDDRWHVRKDGSRFWGSGVLFALRDRAGRHVGYAKLVRNRTDVKTHTEALENQVKALSATQERTRAFLGTLAHEMRNPLAPLANAAQILRAEISPRTREEALRMIERQVDLLGRLVDDLMDTTRIGVGKVSLKLEVLDLTEVFHAAADAARPLAEARAQEFQVLPIAGAVPVRVDAQRMQQVLANLLNNAVKYTPERGKILFNMTTEGGDAIVRVEDTGIGMSADILPRVFDLFTQEESSTAYARGGLGLGLPLVRQLVELHGGTVQARSDGRGKGSVFTVRLPMHRATQP